MSEFKKYQHIERLGTSEVNEITIGDCYIFPKIDGTNASVWLDSDRNVKAGSRTRELTLDKDNAGFYKYILENENIKSFLSDFPHLRLYGEFLVPHSLKTYRDDSWRKFYVFDVCEDADSDSVKYLKYEEYKGLLELHNIEYIPPICIIKNPTQESLYNCLDKTEYLIKDGEGNGEGIVIKNYDYKNRYGRQTWAKIVTNEFKEKHKKSFNPNIITPSSLIEQDIVNKFCTESFIEKEFNKIVVENDGWNSKLIPQLLGVIYHELIVEEIWSIVKTFKNPTINFKVLNTIVIQKIKKVLSNLF